MSESTITAVKPRTMSPYKATSVLNELREAAGLKPVPPQMVYQYVNKEYIPATKVDGKWQIELDAFGDWASAHIEKALARQEKAEKKAKAELEGKKPEGLKVVVEAEGDDKPAEPEQDEPKTDTEETKPVEDSKPAQTPRPGPSGKHHPSGGRFSNTSK